MANNIDTDNSDFLMGRDRMNKEDWLKQQEMEVAILDKVIAHLKLLRDAVACQSLPMNEFGIRKKQYHWVAGETASSKVYKPGMEDCGK